MVAGFGQAQRKAAKKIRDFCPECGKSLLNAIDQADGSIKCQSTRVTARDRIVTCDTIIRDDNSQN